jgi:hypothetical protein
MNHRWSLFSAPAIALAAMAVFHSVPICRGQVTTATFYGIVHDPTGAVVPGATATLTHEGTSAATTKTADAAGEFAFDFLRVGTYALQIEARGFKLYRSTGIELAAGQSVRRTFSLEVGELTESVVVTGEAALVNAVSAEQRQGFSKQEITELPISRRNFSNVLSVGTGINTADGGGVRLNGLGRSAVKVTVDGTDATSNTENAGTSMYQGFNYIDTLSIEAIQEVQVTKGVIPAEYGHQLGGNVNLITRSGSNTYHGSLFENFQAEDLNARNQFLATKAPLTFNQFGGSFGGPIRRDKIFFFTAYEGYRESAFQRVADNVPTAKLREEMLAAQPAYKPWVESLPLPNLPHSPDADTGRYEGTASSAARDNHVVAKSDLLLPSNSTLGLTYTRGRPFRITPRTSPVNPRTWTGIQERGTANFTIGGASWTGETRFGYNLNDISRIDGFWNAGLLPDVVEDTPGGRRVASLSALGFTNNGGSEIVTYFGPVWSIEQKYARHIGEHSLKIGGVYSRRTPGRFNIENGQLRYSTKADLLADRPSYLQNTFGVNRFTCSSYELGFFAQDDWRVSQKLVINLGLRYDYFAKFVANPTDPEAPAGLFNLDGLLDDQFHFGPLRDSDDAVHPDGGLNLAPRIGFAYTPGSNSDTVLRGGLSFMFAPQPADDYVQAVSNSPLIPFRERFSLQDIAAMGLRFPYYNDDTRKLLVAAAKPRYSDVFDPSIQSPYTINLYFGVQKSFFSDLMIESAFVGNRGVKYRLKRVANEPNRLTGIRPNPDLGAPNYFDNSESTTYMSWQTSVRKRYSRNLMGNVHYTWGKALAFSGGDTGAGFSGDRNDTALQDFFDLGQSRGPSTGDITHRFVADFVYDLPALAGLKPGALRQLLGRWQLTGIFRANTGEPFTLGQTSGRYSSRPDYIGGEPILDNYRETLVYLNRAAFAPVPISKVTGATIRAGNVGNNAFRGPGLVRMDLAIGKNFQITESVRFQVRGDLFNAFNHTNYSNPSSGIDSSNFGRITGTRGARTVQLNARLAF